MSFIKNIKNAFGFSDNPIGNDIDDELNYDDTEKREPYINPFKTQTPAEPLKTPVVPAPPTERQAVPTQAKVTAVSYDLPEGFLASIIEIVNANLPQIVKECIDIEAEKKAITLSLGKHFKCAIDDIHSAALAQANAAWDKDRNDITARLNQATAAAEESARRADDAKQKCQVEESKRKALKEQAATLEQRVATLEAEHEQYVIENKGLLNKIKVMQVHADDANTYKDLAEQNEKALAALRAEFADKQKELEEAHSIANEAMSNANEAAKKAADAVDALQKELEAANGATENAKIDAAVARDEVAKAKAALEAKEAEIATLQEQLTEANTNLELMAEIERQLQHLEDFKAQKNKETKDLKAQILDLQAHNESISANAQSCAAESAKLREELQAAKSDAEQNMMRVMQERDAAIKRLSMERADALKQAADESARALEEKEHIIDMKEDEKIRAIEAKDAEISNLIASKNAEIEQIRHELSAEIEKVQKECRAIAKERDRLAGNFATEQRDRKSDVAFYEQKIKFLTTDQKRVENELRAEIKMLKDLQAQRDAQVAAAATPKSPAKAAEPSIDNDIADAVAQTFGFDPTTGNDNPTAGSTLQGFDSAIAGPNAFADIVAEPEEPKIPNDIFDNGTFSDDSIDATFETAASPAPDGNTDAQPVLTDEPSMDELGDIDWLMPTPPSQPEVKTLPEEEEKTAKLPADDVPQKPDAQMSLF